MDERADLSRFTEAHERSFQTALREIGNGRKTSHWMWYIFPQLRGLGKSPTSEYYGVRSWEEAAAFLNDPCLGGNLREITAALLELPTDDPREVFGSTDARKLQSCMTLFALLSEDGSVFHRALDKFFDGRRDGATLRILGKQ